LDLSEAARGELELMGLLGESTPRPGLDRTGDRDRVAMRATRAPDVLNEAYDYTVPSSFSRGMRVELPGATMLFLSGTASIDDRGETVHEGDFAAQLLRTFRNLTRLLIAEEASWHDVARTTCYLRDIERDYETFNRIRTAFFEASGLDPLPASTGIQARLCRSDLLVEIELIAIVPNGAGGAR
jgi:enamine deaminase RidA (YjgF/YER057c/UK114 family)